MQGEDAVVREGDEGSAQAFALVAFAPVVGATGRVGAQEGEGGAEHGALESPVAGVEDMFAAY